MRSSGEHGAALDARVMPGARWFPGSTLNYAEHIFGDRDPAEVAIVSKTEETGPEETTWGELARRTASLAESLEVLGVERGDRVAGYLPNVPEAVVSMLACASIGAVWTSCATDFGTQSVVDRLKQVTPAVLIGTEGYTYRGKKVTKRGVLMDVAAAIPSIRKTIVVSHSEGGEVIVPGALHWDDLTKSGATQRFERVPFDHPLFVVYSSGTTGLPKPIVHGHGGILLEHLKVLSFHNDLGPRDRMFWYTSTGWMMWNYLTSALLLGSRIILYDGDPLHPDPSALWSLAETTGMTFLGASAAYVNALMKSGFEPRSSYSLERLRGFGSTGSALSADAFEWVYARAKEDIWLASVSGGTDLCTAFVGGCPVLPVRAGEIQCRNLGADVAAFDESGAPVVGEMGELVIRQPMPSMPIFFWGDPSGSRYHESYFGTFPGVWRHGDWIMVNEDGSCVIFGRSDATIKRMGVRMGTSELYRVVEAIPQVADSLVVDTEYLGGRSYMPLFVVLRDGAELDDALRTEIKRRIRDEVSPRMVPDQVVAAPEIPRTLNGKKVEVPIRRIFLGAEPSSVYHPGSLRNPEAMAFFVGFAKKVRE